MSTRTAIALTLGALLVVAWYGVRFEGQPRPVDPLQTWALPEVQTWKPSLLRKTGDPAAIYVVHGLPASDDRFDAIRLDLESGIRSSTRIIFGPGTEYEFFDEAEHAATANIELDGLLLRRPTPILFTIPATGGPALEFVDSATGVLRVVVGAGASKRTVLRLTVVNSSRVAEMRALLWSDRQQRVAAFLWRVNYNWHLYVFPLNPS